MQIINVIEVKEGTVDTITSFAVHEDQLIQDVIKEAEVLFLKKVTEKHKELGFTEELEEDEILLDNGYWIAPPRIEYSIQIVWSEV